MSIVIANANFECGLHCHCAENDGVWHGFVFYRKARAATRKKEWAQRLQKSSNPHETHVMKFEMPPQWKQPVLQPPTGNFSNVAKGQKAVEAREFLWKHSLVCGKLASSCLCDRRGLFRHVSAHMPVARCVRCSRLLCGGTEA